MPWIGLLLLGVLTTWHASVPISGDTAATAIAIPGLPFTVQGNTSSFNDDHDENCPFVAPGAPDVVYSFTPAASSVPRMM